jgi:hypothetical protein
VSRPPIAAPETEGRIFGSDWSIANVAKLLRSNATRGVWRSTSTTGGSIAVVNQYYLRTVSARHLPTAVSLIFMRLENQDWYASLCFADEDYLPWNEDAAEQWLYALFGEERPRVREVVGAVSKGIPNRSVRQFTLSPTASAS